MRGVVFAALLTAAAQPAGAYAQCAPNAPQVVDDVYKQVLERPADPGSAGFAQALGSGQMTVRDVVAAVAKSDEHRARFVLGPLVAGVYRQLMRRDPTPDELQTNTSALASGAESVDDFVAHTAVRAVNNRPDAVRMLYVTLLGREPDPGGLTANTEGARQQGLEAVAQSMVHSDEYRARAASDAGVFAPGVRAVYQHLLGHAPEPEAFQQAMQLATVYGIDGVVDRIVTSREYQQSFGDYVVPGRSQTQFCGPRTSEQTAVPRNPRFAFPRRR